MVKVLKYNQAKMDILQTIVAKKLQVGDRLPSLREFLEESNFSAITLRRAMDDLEQQGIIAKQQGTGSFLNKEISGKAKFGHLVFIEIYRFYSSIGSEHKKFKKLFLDRGFDLKIFTASEPNQEITESARNCAGVFVSGWLSRAWVDYLKAFGVPVTVIGTNPFPDELPGVGWHLAQGVSKLTAELFESGSRCFGLLPGGKEYHTTLEIRQGFANEVKRRGLNPDSYPSSVPEAVDRYSHEEILDLFNRNPQIDTLLLNFASYQNVLELLYNGMLPPSLRLGVVAMSKKSRFAVKNTYFLIFEGELYRKAADAFWAGQNEPELIRKYIDEHYHDDEFTIIKPPGG